MAFLKPFALILENAGIGPVNASGIGSRGDGFQVYDALQRSFVDWWTGGIMDPTKVTLSAVENALSVAQLLMTLGGAIVIKQTPEVAQVRAMQQGMIKAIQDDALGT
jgi:chaperonin GroEL